MLETNRHWIDRTSEILAGQS